MTCAYEGCEKPPHIRGLCRSHYQRLMRRGTSEPKNAPAGGASKRLIIGVSAELDRAVRLAAKREGVTLQEWWRRAAAERVARQGKGR